MGSPLRCIGYPSFLLSLCIMYIVIRGGRTIIPTTPAKNNLLVLVISLLTGSTPFGGIEFACHTPFNHARILRVLGTRTGAFCINLSQECCPYHHRSVRNHSSLSPLVTQIPLIAAWLIGGEGVALWWGFYFSAFVFKLSSSLDR